MGSLHSLRINAYPSNSIGWKFWWKDKKPCKVMTIADFWWFFFLLQFGGTVNVDKVIDVLIKSCYAFGVIFSICEFGQQLSNRFDEIHSSIWELDWFSFPIENKKTLIVVLAIAQRPARIVTFGNVEVTRETCKSVIFIHFLNDFLSNFSLLSI